MNNTTTRIFFRLISAGVFLAASAGAQANLQEGIDAYNKSEHQAALAEFEPLAAKGDAVAQLYLGRIYMQGQGSQPDYNKAISWARKAAERKNVEAQYFLGFLHHYGLGAPQDYREALSWYRRAAERGNAKAQTSLGSMFANGQGAPQDLVKAYKWFKLAAASGEADALVKLKAAEAQMTPKQIKEAETGVMAQKKLMKLK